MIFLQFSPIFIFILTVLLGGGKTVYNFSIISILIIVIWVIHLIKVYFKGGFISIPKFSAMPVLFLVLLSAVSLLSSRYLFASLKNTLQLIIYVVYFIISMEYLRHKNVNLNLLVVIMICVVQSIVVIIQKISGNSIVGFFPENPNLAAAFIGTITVVCIGLLVHKNTNVYTGNLRYFIPFSIITGITSLLIISARGSLAAVVIAVGYIIGKKFKARGIAVYIACLAVLLVIFNQRISTYYFKFKSYDPHAFYRPRPQIWSSAIKIIADNPLCGVGLGNFGNYFPRHNFPAEHSIAKYGKFTDFAHNEFLQIGAELGIPGFLVIIWLLNRVLLISKKNIPIFAGIITMLIQSLLDINLHLPANIFLLIVLLSLSMHRLSGDSFKFKITRRKAFVFFLLSGIIAGLFINIFLAESYSKRDMYETAAKFNPVDAKNYYLRSKMSTNVKDKIKLLNKCVELNPEKYQYYENLAAAYWDLSRTDRRHIIKAIACYKNVLDKNPYNAPVYFFMGNVFYDMKEYRKAWQYFIKANSIEPNFIRSLIFAARCSRSLGEEDRAKIEYRRAARLKQKLKFYPEPKSNYEKFLIN